MIASVWARLLAKALVDTLRNGAPANVVRYDDYAHFLAAFLADLAAGQAWRHWMYQEFRPLEDVPVGRAAALLLSPHPELLEPVAQRLQAQQQWEALVQRMGIADINLIWERGFGFTALPPMVSLDSLDGPLPYIPLERGGEIAFLRNRLRLFVALRARKQPPSLIAAATLSHHAALLQWFADQHPVRWLWSAFAEGEIKSTAAIAQLLAVSGKLAATLEDWLERVLPAAEGRRYLAEIVKATQPDTIIGGPSIRPQQIVSAFAGMSLLLPSLRALALREQLGATGIYHLLLDAAGPPARPLAWGDLGIMWFAGIEPDQVETARQTFAEDDIHPTTLAVLRHFAAGLRGFANSSPAYLAETFLNQPGYLVITDETVDVYLSQSPLAIILHMAGKTGEQGVIPWRDGRALAIHLP
jgi:hypothetical protein